MARQLQQAEFRTSLADYSFRDDATDVGYWFDPEPQKAAAVGTRVKKLRRDFLTGVEVAAREVARVKPQMVLGFGQGATIALILARPRLCEIALQSKVVQEAELKSTGLAAAWQGIQAIVIATPCIFRARTRIDLLKEALPEVMVPTPGPTERPLDCFSLGWTHPHQAYEKELVELLGVSTVKGTEQILLDSLLKRRPLQLNHHYRCSCGKATLLLPMCLEVPSWKFRNWRARTQLKWTFQRARRSWPLLIRQAVASASPQC